MDAAAIFEPGVPERDRPIAIALLAMGGQGGGVLCDWIVDIAERAGWFAQSTSVPGVAQRTGATIYYIEMLPPRDGRAPVLSLMPNPGDVDIVLAAEFMEAGRAMLRGLVTPGRTTLIASTHRSFAIAEKSSPGDGIASSETVAAAGAFAARRSVLFDMQAIAEAEGSVISAALLGALAGAACLPFTQDQFEATIRAGGRGAEASLRTFRAALARTATPPAPATPASPAPPGVPRSVGTPALDALLARLHGDFPPALHSMLYAGLRRLVDFQDPAYAAEYLDQVAGFLAIDTLPGGNHALSLALAKYLAQAMAYDDVIRVADLKTRATRFARVRGEAGITPDQLLTTTEFMHPRGEEVIGTLPAGLGRWLEARPALSRLLDRAVNRGRRVRTGTIFWFLVLYAIAGLRPYRRSLLRHGREMAHIRAWLDLARQIAAQDYALAVEIINCRRLVKGYSDTHARGQSKFDRVLATAPSLAGKPGAAAWLARLRSAALADEDGTALAGALATLATAYV